MPVMVRRLAWCSLALSTLPASLILSALLVMHIVLGEHKLIYQGEHFDGKSLAHCIRL